MRQSSLALMRSTSHSGTQSSTKTCPPDAFAADAIDRENPAPRRRRRKDLHADVVIDLIFHSPHGQKSHVLGSGEVDGRVFVKDDI
mmetsp:Transcript_30262/g.64470  ORF Transcript_30262/g.64470 Transcript_30262/m.64470 type:complete len:86 (+) Transcript_30262:117-374(+)